MQDAVARIRQIAGRAARKPLTWVGVTGMTCAAVVLGAVPAQATAYPPSTSACTYSNSATRANSADVVGVTPGSAITIACGAGSFPASGLLVVVEASGLAGVVSPSSQATSEIDLGALQLVSAGADGSLADTFTVPAAFAASDPTGNAVCPATKAQINTGLACNLIIANLSAQPLDEATITYAGQPKPNRPTLRIRTAGKRGVNTLTVSDAPGACTIPATDRSRCWWGAPVPGSPNADFLGIPGLTTLVGGRLAANTLQVSPAVYCADGATAAACAGQPAGTLVPPQLTGTITTRSSGFVSVDEPNTTPYPGNSFLWPLEPRTRNVEVTGYAAPPRIANLRPFGPVWFW